MYPCMKFQSFCRTSNYEIKFAQKNMTDKNFEKINTKIVIHIIAMYACTKFQLIWRTSEFGDKHKDIFACLFSIHNTISLSCHEQVSLSGLRFERYAHI